MSYCKLKNIWTTEWNCLECEHCLPPSERINGMFCENEEIGETSFIDYDEEEDDYHILFI